MSIVEEYLKQMNDELPKLAEMIHGDTVNEGACNMTWLLERATFTSLFVLPKVKWLHK
jgi:hypothetical protein